MPEASHDGSDSMPDRSFWKGRRVFLTGHTGFKGSWLSLWLDALGADVTGYALDPPTQPSLFEQAEVAGTVRSICADIRDFPRLKAAIAECRPDVVIHMAAQSVVRRGYEDPIETYSSNVMGTVHLLEALRQLGQPCVGGQRHERQVLREPGVGLGISRKRAHGRTRSVFEQQGLRRAGDHRRIAIRIFDPRRFERHGVAVASARAGNAIGGGDWTRDQLIPDLMRAFLAGQSCLIRSPSAIRPWQFVLEPLRGYLMLAERLAEDAARFASAWNFGPAEADAKPVSWIADELATVVG